MRKGAANILWVVFLLIIPSIYILLKKVFPDDLRIEIIIVYAPYLLSIITIMARLDMRLYLVYKRLVLFLFGADTAWLFNVRYTNIHSQYQVLITLEQVLIQHGCKIIQSNNTFLTVLYDNTNMLNFRLENPASQDFDLHFYTSKIEVPYKSIEKKIKNLSKVTEIIENTLDMPDKNLKQYEIQIIYSENNPYYSYWIETVPGEKIKSLNCKLYDKDNSIIEVYDNQIRFLETSMHGLFFKIRNHLTLRGL